MAAATITIIITDSTVTLVDLRDTLCNAWGYTGANTNPAKVQFIKDNLIKYIRQTYRDQKRTEADVSLRGIETGTDIA